MPQLARGINPKEAATGIKQKVKGLRLNNSEVEYMYNQAWKTILPQKILVSIMLRTDSQSYSKSGKNFRKAFWKSKFWFTLEVKRYPH